MNSSTHRNHSSLFLRNISRGKVFSWFLRKYLPTNNHHPCHSQLHDQRQKRSQHCPHIVLKYLFKFISSTFYFNINLSNLHTSYMPLKNAKAGKDAENVTLILILIHSVKDVSHYLVITPQFSLTRITTNVNFCENISFVLLISMKTWLK